MTSSPVTPPTAPSSPDQAQPVRNLRMLCLHGYHGTGAILRSQMTPLAAAIPPGVELVYVDAPSLSEGDFGWWHEGFRGWERTRDWVIELLRTGPRIDGIFGFSQGAALTGLLAALRDSDPSTPQFEFAIMAGGFHQHHATARRTFPAQTQGALRPRDRPGRRDRAQARLAAAR